MKRYIERLTPKGRIGRSVMVLMGGTAMAQLITAASTPIITRLYTPEMIGVISVYLAFFNFWNSLLTWRYDNALLIASDEQELHNVFRLGSILCIVMSGLALPVASGFQQYGILGFDVLPSWAPVVLFLSLLGFGWFTLYRAWLLRLGKVRLISHTTIARSASNVATRIFFGMIGGHVYGLFIAEIFGSWSALGTARKEVQRLKSKVSPSWRLKSIKDVALRYRKFAQYEMPSVIINQLALALPVPIVGFLYGAQAAGWFGLARLLYAIPNAQIGKAAGDVFQMELSSKSRENELKKGERLFYKFSIYLALVGLFPLALATFAAPPLVPYIFGEEWDAMGLIVASMGPWMYLALIVSSMSRALSVLQKQQWKLVYDVLALVVVALSYYLSDTHQLGVLGFVQSLSFGMAIAYVIYFIIIASTLRKATILDRIDRQKR